MPKQTLLISLVGILGLLSIVWWLSISWTTFFPPATSHRIILFSTVSCAKCQEVENWLKTQKINFERKEVNTPAVQAELQQAVTDCQLNTEQGIELPLLVAEGKCSVGSTEIKNFFTQKTSAN